MPFAELIANVSLHQAIEAIEKMIRDSNGFEFCELDAERLALAAANIREKLKPVKCICEPNQEAVKCPRHGRQEANRPLCPTCGKAVLGFCAQGEYCTSETCSYVA